MKKWGFQITEPEHNDINLVETFLDQPDRDTYSGLKFSDCFSSEKFPLVFDYGTTMQKCAVRQALISCLALPELDLQCGIPARHLTFERHLHNWVLHTLTRLMEDASVPAADRNLADDIIKAECLRGLTSLWTETDQAQGMFATEAESQPTERFDAIPHREADAFAIAESRPLQQGECLEIPPGDVPVLGAGPSDKPLRPR